MVLVKLTDTAPARAAGSNTATAKPKPSPTLKGHKILFQVPVQPPESYLSTLRAHYPDLVIELRDSEASGSIGKDGEEAGSFDGVTVLVTGGASLPQSRAAAPDIIYVQLWSAGVDHLVDVPFWRETEKEEVDFCTAKGVHAPQIAEWAIATYLSFQHRLPRYLDLQKKARWERDPRPVDDAVSRTVGILGYGNIGRQIARVAVALGMRVHAYTLHPRPTPESRRDDPAHAHYAVPGLGDPEGVLPAAWYSGRKKEELAEFLGSGLDWLVVSVPLTEETRGLLGREEFEVLRRGGRGGDVIDSEGRRATRASAAAAKRKRSTGTSTDGKVFLTNIARGAIVDSDALVDALRHGWLAGAALDVTDPEPLPREHSLWDFASGYRNDGEVGDKTKQKGEEEEDEDSDDDRGWFCAAEDDDNPGQRQQGERLIVTPHVSGLSTAYGARVLDIVSINLARLAKGEPLINLVKRNEGY